MDAGLGPLGAEEAAQDGHVEAAGTEHIRVGVGASERRDRRVQPLIHSANNSAGLMPTETRGNYLPEAPLTYARQRPISELYACERVDTRHWHEWHSQPLELTRHAGNYFVPDINTAHFYFLLQELCQVT